MSIILRVNKGAALTYDEMDRNQSQFFYSSSLHSSGTTLRLHYTGSTALTTGGENYSPRYTEINFPTTDTTGIESVAAGNDKQIQFKDGETFGVNSGFVFDKDNIYQGIGTGAPSAKLDIHGESNRGAIVILRGSDAGTGEGRNAYVSFNKGSTLIGKIGKTVSDNSNDLFFTNTTTLTGGNYGKLNFSIGTDANIIGTFSYSSDGDEKKFGVGTTTPSRQISLVGSKGIGLSTGGGVNQDSYLTPLPSEIISQEVGGIRKLIPLSSEPAGLLISSPNSDEGGNVVVAINTDGNLKEGFNIIKSTGGKYDSSEVIASFQVSGKVGINTNFPPVIGLTVEGAISGSGNLEIDGTAKIGTIATGTAENTSALVATSTGLVQKIAAAPVPLGGIIMWSGAPNAIPGGWTLCDGLGGLNGVTVPDLRNKFVVAANSTGATATTNIEGSDNTTGGSNSHRHGNAAGEINTDERSVNYKIPKDGYSISAGANSPEDLRKNGYNVVTENAEEKSEYLESIAYQAADRSLTSDKHLHTVVIPPTNNIPAYYALAFIIYVGS